MRLPGQALPRYRAPISTRAPTMLIMNGPERFLYAPGGRDRDPAGSGTKRAGNTEPDIVVAVVGLVPVAVGRAEVLWIVVPGTAAQNAKRLGPFRRRGASVRGPAAEEIRSSGAGDALSPGGGASCFSDAARK